MLDFINISHNFVSSLKLAPHFTKTAKRELFSSARQKLATLPSTYSTITRELRTLNTTLWLFVYWHLRNSLTYLLARWQSGDLLSEYNPFKPSCVKWLHFSMFMATLVWPTFLIFLTLGHSGARDWAPECPNVKQEALLLQRNRATRYVSWNIMAVF